MEIRKMRIYFWVFCRAFNFGIVDLDGDNWGRWQIEECFVDCFVLCQAKSDLQGKFWVFFCEKIKRDKKGEKAFWEALSWKILLIEFFLRSTHS
jgi:hypothetical protein